MTVKKINITINPKVNFSDLELKRTDGEVYTYKLTILEQVLEDNNVSLSQLTQDDIESLLIDWYLAHRKAGGGHNGVMESIILAVSKQPRFDIEIEWDAMVEPPTPEQICELRTYLKLTQSQVANLLELTNRQLVSSYENGARSPSRQTWTLFLLLTGQHPTLTLTKRSANNGANLLKKP